VRRAAICRSSKNRTSRELGASARRVSQADVKSHYELLGLDPASDGEAIKKAFRREIARYHPDKVSHLGSEFQAMAATKAAELTTAYTTLSNASLRAAYDAGLAGAPMSSPEPPREPQPGSDSAAPASPEVPRTTAPQSDDRSDIVRRAALGRLRTALASALPDGAFVSVPGFDLASISRGKPSLFRRTALPSVLVRLAAVVDKDVVVDAYTQAIKAKIEQKPVVLLLAGDRLAPLGELAQAIDDHRRRNPALADVLLPVPLDLRDFTARIPANVPTAVKQLIDTLKSHAG
jgi:DnaJ-like protein